MRSKNFQLELATLGPGESSFHKGGSPLYIVAVADII